MDVATLVRTLVGVVVLMVVTLGVLIATRSPHPWAPLLAILRGLVQLALLSVILSGVITDPRWVALALLVMFGVAVSVSARRLGGRARLGPVGVAMGAGVLVALGVVFATGSLDLTARYALAIGGIVIGNAMSIATISGRRLLELADDGWDEIEGWFALGATPREATRRIARDAVYGALIPTVDQTKTTGLVTLPGAFVGAIFGGVSPLEAGRFQIVVLAAIMCAGAITAAVLVAFLRPLRMRPVRPR
ncbi:ABC transporter permease [Pseudolysinimonas sp.]|uniref:ABC transporter permease n=1 Tax=Pseudolysinimonas sp. TaxID=2680009 RepID=UPI003F7F382A